MDDGTTSRDTFRISDELDALGARLSTSSSLDLSFVRLNALAATLVPSLTVMADVVRNPAFPADLFALEQKRRASRRSARRRRNRSARRSARCRGALRRGACLWQSVHRVRRREERGGAHAGRSRGVASRLVPACRQHPHRHRRRDDGRAETRARGRVRRMAERDGAVQVASETVPPPAGGRVYLIDEPDATQSVIMAGHVTERGGAPADLAIDTVMRNFGGIATSRLNRNLRLDKHWSYGVQGALPASRGPRPFYVWHRCRPTRRRSRWSRSPGNCAMLPGSAPWPARNSPASCATRHSACRPFRDARRARERGRAVGQSRLRGRLLCAVRGACAGTGRSGTRCRIASVHPARTRSSGWSWAILRRVEAGIRDLKFGEVIRLDGDGRPLADSR